jgi:hypothetical protein
MGVAIAHLRCPRPTLCALLFDLAGCCRRDAGMWAMRLLVFPISNRLTVLLEKHGGFAASVQSIVNYPKPSFTPTQTSNIHDYCTSPTCRRVPFPSTGLFLCRDTLLPPDPPRVTQTLTEKIVQHYSLGLSKDQYVKAGDYVVLSPHHCMTR